MVAFCTVGSAAARSVNDSPSASMSTQGEMHQPQPGNGNPASRIASNEPTTKPAAGAVASQGDAVRLETALQQIAIGGDCVLHRCGERMLRRQAVIDRQCARAGRAAYLRHQMPMAVQRANDVAAAVQIQNGAGSVGIRRRSPFRPHTVRATGCTDTSAGNGKVFARASASRRICAISDARGRAAMMALSSVISGRP